MILHKFLIIYIRQKDGVIGVGTRVRSLRHDFFAKSLLRPQKWISGHATYSLFLTYLNMEIDMIGPRGGGGGGGGNCHWKVDTMLVQKKTRKKGRFSRTGDVRA